MMAEDARYTHPLMGVVICCTSIAPETRSDLSSKAMAMGAVHRQDLTSDVTHLVVGDPDTPKYKYVARNRIDVKVVDAGWVAAMHEKWITGEDIKISDFEEEHKFPPFLGLKISVTNISDSDERSAIQKLLTSHGADYHPDLTRQVTHLIAAVPEGRKYEFAKQWEIRIVSPHWLFHSIERGMALDEGCYDPKLPKGRIGVGARPEALVIKQEIVADEGDGKETAESSRTAVEEQSQGGKRRIREDVSRMIEGHSQSIWEDIIGQAGTTKARKRDEWDETRETEDSKSEKARLPRKRRTIFDEEEDEELEQDISGNLMAIQNQDKLIDGGMFSDKMFCIYGFGDEHKVGVLRTTIESHSGHTITANNLQSMDATSIQSSLVYIIVPEIFPKKLYPTPSGNTSFKVVSFWWIERCLHSKRFTEPKYPGDGGDDIDIFCFPFDLMPLNGFEGMEIVTTGFSGVNLMHVTKVIGLTGAKYKDTVNARKTNMIISAVDSAKTDKAQAGLNWNIPVVTVKWLTRCIMQGEWVDFDDFLVSGVRKRVRANEEGERKRLRPALEVSDGQSTTALSGCVIAVSKSLEQSRAAELKTLAISLGAKVVEKFSRADIDLLTHLVHVTNASEKTSKEFRVAKTISGCYIVSPVWVQKCQEDKQKVDEKAYPPAYQQKVGEKMKPNEETATKHPSQSQKSLITSESLAKGRRNPFEIDDSEEEGSDEGKSDNLKRSKAPRSRSPKSSKEVSNLEDTESSIDGSVATKEVSNLEETESSIDFSVATKTGFTEILKFGIDKLSTALDKPRKPRGRLRGKATTNMSVFPDVAMSRENSALSTENGRSELADPLLLREGSDKSKASVHSGLSGPRNETNCSLYLTQSPPQSQAVSYADPEAQLERKKMMAKLDGVEAVDTPAKTMKESRVAVVQDTYRVRRSTRNHQE